MKINLPGSIIDLPTLSEEDEQIIIEFGLKHNIDFIAASFVRKASDVEYIKNLLANHGSQVKVIAKIENHEGLHNFDEILIEADGVILSRNEISMEIPPEKVFIAQKWMTEKANLCGKPIIMFQQIFMSMMNYPRPSRAEANEVCNAVVDGVDGFILDRETADGHYPVNVVQSLVKCVLEAERTIDWRKSFNDIKMYSPGPYGSAESVACASVASVLDLKVDLIVVATETGKIARMVSKYKPMVPIVLVSSNSSIVKQVAI